MVAVDAAVSRLSKTCRIATKTGYHYFRPTSVDNRNIIFVAGQQRSGTNMIMDVLDRHWSTDVYHETDRRAFNNYAMRDIAVIKELYQQSKAEHFIIKALCELQHLRDLLNAFPRSKAIWTIRHHHDVSNSMKRQFSTTAKALKLMRKDPALGGWRGEKMSTATYALLDKMIDHPISECSAAAFQWYMRNILYFEQELDSDDRVKLVRYEDLVTQPTSIFLDLMSFLAIDFRQSAVHNIFATSIGKAEQPAIDPAIDRLCNKLYGRFSSILQSKH